MNCLKETNSTNGVDHCFASDINFAYKLFEIGYYISFTGLITFSKELTNVVKEVPLDSYDSVFVCTPDNQKLDIIKYCINNKKHVLVEKPLLTRNNNILKK